MDDNASGAEDTTLTIDVLANDVDADGTIVAGTLQIIIQAANGTATVDSSSSQIIYTPNQDFNGTDTLTYQVCDDDGACASAVVTVVVSPVNDPPVANDDTADSAEDTSEIVPILANDTDVDGDPLTVISVSQPANGTASTNGSVAIYLPNANFDGTDIFTYTVSDGTITDTATVTISLISINDPPIGQPDSYTTSQNNPLIVSAPGILANDSDIDGDPLTAVLNSGPANGSLTLAASGAFTYTPVVTGTDSFTYVADDGIATSAVVSVTIVIQ